MSAARRAQVVPGRPAYSPDEYEELQKQNTIQKEYIARLQQKMTRLQPPESSPQAQDGGSENANELPLTEFPLFPKLPRELRELVYLIYASPIQLY